MNHYEQLKSYIYQEQERLEKCKQEASEKKNKDLYFWCDIKLQEYNKITDMIKHIDIMK